MVLICQHLEIISRYQFSIYGKIELQLTSVGFSVLVQQVIYKSIAAITVESGVMFYPLRDSSEAVPKTTHTPHIGATPETALPS